MTLERVGLLSPGEMGHVVGKVLIDHGMPVLTCLEGRSDRTRERAEAAGIEAVSDTRELVKEAGLILSIMVPSEAIGVTREVAEVLTQANESVVYVDCNAVAPATARQMGEIITAAGSIFVDAGIIGPPPRQEGKTRFYTSGPDVTAFASLSEHGLDIRPVGNQIGQASGLKMTYAALTKGTAALCTELMVAAKRMGLYDDLVAEFKLSQSGRYKSIEGLTGMPSKAGRWIGEMEEIAKTFGDLGMTPRIYHGAADIYRMVSGADVPTGNLEEMIECLAKSLDEPAVKG